MNLREQFETAVAAHRAGQLAEAEDVYRRLIAQAPDLAAAHHNLVALLREQQRFEDLPQAYDGLIGVEPQDETQYLRAVARLRLGLYAEAWPGWELRPSKAPSAPRGGVAEWRGEALDGKRILIWEEQGFGDQIQMARYILLLQARGATVQYACRDPLRRLIGRFCETVPRYGEVSGRWDYWICSLSLPGRFQTTLETIPPPLAVPSRAGGVGVGVAVRGNPQLPDDATRSLPAEAGLTLRSLPGAVSLEPEDSGAKDFETTRELISGLRRVVTVDTAVAHLAGSMGKPTWILLPAIWPDWRWMLRREDTPWYPSVRLLRQPAAGDWASVLRHVEAEWTA
ncbi:hypothetical protein [Phenylobacterium sp.]|uniref:hypothetical protein n=1 Tax=Phenylobacterium sp. TaxID=1871053 RepID=UPI00260010A8|nr:hypothetical protein [Phenylobacterium sp.]